MFFADLRTAFYRAIKDLLVKLPWQGEELEWAVDNMERPLVFQDCLSQAIAQPTILDKELQDAHFKAMVAEAMAASKMVEVLAVVLPGLAARTPKGRPSPGSAGAAAAGVIWRLLTP